MSTTATPAKKTAAAKPPAKKTPTKKAVEGGATSSTAAPKKTVAAAAPAATVGTLQHVPPGQLLLERNIRKPKLDPDFLASIKDLGVLQPITAVTNPDGRLVVRFGERRALAAIEVGLATVPVYVAGDDDQADAAEVDRIIRQRDENTHRAGLTPVDDLHVVEQLVAFGISADQISDRARMPKAQVDAAVAVSGSKLAASAAAKYESLTLDQAAAVAEFESDADTAKNLILTAIERPDNFAHLLQRKRDDREEARLMLEGAADLEEAGVNVIARPSYEDKTKRLDRLVDAATGKQVTPANHAKCPGHVAWVTVQRKGSDRVLAVVPEYGCRDPGKNGHRDQYASQSASRPKATDMPDAEREKAKAERRLVIENNKAWRSAEPVRREWLANFAKAKTPPKGAAAFVVETLDQEARLLTENAASTLACDLLSAPTRPGQWGGTRSDVTSLLKSASENRALQIALIQSLAAYEAALTDMSWRQDGKRSREGRYLRFLESAGYPLSDVEKFAVSSKTAKKL